MKGMAVRAGTSLRHSRPNGHLVCAPKCPRGWVQPLCIHVGYPAPQRKESCVATISEVLIRTFNECLGNVVRSIGRYDVVTHVDTAF